MLVYFYFCFPKVSLKIKIPLVKYMPTHPQPCLAQAQKLMSCHAHYPDVVEYTEKYSDATYDYRYVMLI